MKNKDDGVKGVGGVDGKLFVEELKSDGAMEESVFFLWATTRPEVERLREGDNVK